MLFGGMSLQAWVWAFFLWSWHTWQKQRCIKQLAKSTVADATAKVYVLLIYSTNEWCPTSKNKNNKKHNRKTTSTTQKKTNSKNTHTLSDISVLSRWQANQHTAHDSTRITLCAALWLPDLPVQHNSFTAPVPSPCSSRGEWNSFLSLSLMNHSIVTHANITI